MKYEVNRCLIIEWTSLPHELNQLMRKSREHFGNDMMMEYVSELSPVAGGSWGDNVTLEAIQSYYEDQRDHNNYKGTLDDFIKDYGLQFDKYLLDNDIDLTDIDRIIINICW